MVTLQYGLPVNNPESNVLVKESKNVIHIEVPINYPDIHKLSITDLLNHWAAKQGQAVSLAEAQVKVTHKPNNKIAVPERDR